MVNQRYEYTMTIDAERTLSAIYTVIRQSAGDDYFLYENPPCWCLGLGRVATLQIDAAGKQALEEQANGEHRYPINGTLADCARQFVRNYAEKAPRIYGMAAFNYAARVRGLPFTPGTWPLLNLVIPRCELIFQQGQVTIYAPTEAECQRLSTMLCDINDPPNRPVMAVDTAQCGDDYRQRVARALAEIDAGDYEKVIVSRMLALPAPLDIPATWWLGRQKNTPARSFLFRLAEREATGFSPELVVRVEQERAMTEPLAGTRARTDNAQQNAQQQQALISDSKEIVEHIISVKEAIRELNQVCRPASVVVNDLMSVRERGSVLHLGSQVSGQLGEGQDAWDVFDELFPAITASGIPKTAALAAIQGLESVPRELYSGAVMFIENPHRFDAALVLRSAFQDSHRQWIQAGAGIIAQSTPERELTETQEKLASIAPYVVVKCFVNNNHYYLQD